MNRVMERNHVNVYGDGEQAVMFAHGFGCDQSMWQYILPAFISDYRVITFDYVGSGHSDLAAYDSEKYSTLQGYAQDILDIIEAMQLERVTFIGHSVSSMIGMLAAIEKPEYFQKLIMIGPSPCYINDHNGYNGGFEKNDIVELLAMMEMNFHGWASYMAPIGMGQLKESGLSRRLEESFVSTDPQVARQFAEVTFYSDYRASLSQFSVPALIIQCSEDSIVPIEVGQYLHQHMKQSTLHIMEAKGHYPHISHPLETTSIITQYMSS